MLPPHLQQTQLVDNRNLNLNNPRNTKKSGGSFIGVPSTAQQLQRRQAQ
jgi:hypothetical protein